MGQVKTFNEGDKIVLRANGDKSGYGCSFELEECCYIHKDREESRGKKLCNALKQPEHCRQPGGGSYEVEEPDGPIGWCKLTIFKAKPSDSGEYRVSFPFEPEKYNQNINVKVKAECEGSSMAAAACCLLLLASLLAFGLLLLLFKLVKSVLVKREGAHRHKDEIILQKLKKDLGAFKEELGDRHILELRDRFSRYFEGNFRFFL